MGVPCNWRGKCFSSGNELVENNWVMLMLWHLMCKIKSTGPVTVAEYLKGVPTNPAKGCHVRHDMLGEKGDFTTSPEMSPVFGELLRIWSLSEWKRSSFPAGGTGSRSGYPAGDSLRVFSHLGSVLKYD